MTAPKAKDVFHIGIIGRRWFSKSRGNSQYTSEIFINGKRVAKLGPASGYGSQYEYSAAEWLIANGYLSKPPYGPPILWQLTQDSGIEFNSEALDVPRQKDL